MPFHQNSGFWMTRYVIRLLSLMDLSHCFYKMSFLVRSHIMWDINIESKEFNKYTGGDAGRNIVEE